MAIRRPLFLNGNRIEEISDADQVVNLSPGRNRVIDGAMIVNQRGAGVTALIGSVHYPTDRITAYCTAGGGSVYTAQHPAGGVQAYTQPGSPVTDLTGTKHFSGIRHRMEAVAMAGIGPGDKITISFKADTNWAGKLAISVYQPVLNISYVQDVDVIAGTNKIEVSIDGISVTPNIGVTGLLIVIGACSQGSYATTPGSWKVGVFFCTTSATQWVKAGAGSLQIQELQVEKGPIATPFEYVNYPDSLLQCQRFYEKGVVRLQGYSLAGQNIVYVHPYKVTKARNPTVTFSGFGYYNTSGAGLAGGSAEEAMAPYATITNTGPGGFTANFEAVAELP